MKALLGYAERVAIENAYCILYIASTYDGVSEPDYVYLRLQASDIEKLREAIQKPYFTPSEFGEVLFCGKGEPSGTVKCFMQSEYGFNHEQMVIVNNDIHSA